MQILRSNTTATPGSLANGQLAYTSNGDILYIGSPATSTPVIPIGGKMYPGTLTANLALVANSTSGLNNIIVGTLTLQGNATTNGSISANGSVGTGGQVLLSGGSGANAYWGAGGGGGGTPGGANSQIQINESGTFGGTSALTFNVASNTFSITDGSSNTFIANSSTLIINNASSNVIINSTAIFLSSNVAQTTITAGYSTLVGLQYAISAGFALP